MDVISLYICCKLASSLYTLFHLYKTVGLISINVSIMHLLHLSFAHFKQSCSENTGAYKPVRFPAPFVITTVDCYVLFSLNMSSYLFTSVDIYIVPVLLPCVMTINWLNWTELLVNFVPAQRGSQRFMRLVRIDLCGWIWPITGSCM